MDKMNFRAKKSLFTAQQLKLYGQLLQIAEDELHILSLQPLTNVLEPDVNQWERNSGWDYMLQKVSGKIVDFVICDSDWQVLCLIDFIDSETGEQIDAVLSDAAYTAKIPLLNLFSYQQLGLQELAEKIAEEVQKKQS